MLNYNQDITPTTTQFTCEGTCFGFGCDKQCAICGTPLPKTYTIFFPQQEFTLNEEKSLIPSGLRMQTQKKAQRAWRRHAVCASFSATKGGQSNWRVQTNVIERSLGFAHRKPARQWGWATVGPKSLYGKYIQTSGAEEDAWFHFMEVMLISFYQACRAKTWADQMVAIAAFAKMTDNPLCPFRMTYTTIFALFTHFFPPEQAEESTDGLKVQNQSSWDLPSLDNVEDWLEFYKNLKGSKCYTKVYRFFMYAMSLSLFSKVGIDMDVLRFEPVAQAAIKAKYHMGEDFIITMLDTMVFVCKRGYQCYVTGSLVPLYHSSDKYQEWIDEAELMTRRAAQLCNAQAHGFDKFSYLADLKSVIERGDSIRQFANTREDKLMIGRLLNGLKLNYDNETTKRSAQRIRSAPYALLIHGESSVGKSSFVDLLYKHYGKVRKLQTNPEFRYTRNPAEEYWSGYDTSKWCIVLDDIGFMSPSLGTMDPSLQELLYVVNNTPYVPAQAELCDKGRTPVMAELVIGTTNTAHLNVHSYFSCPLAVQRRFPYVLSIKPKPEYQTPDRPGMLASHLRPPSSEDAYDDLWIIKVSKVVPVIVDGQAKMGTLKEEHTFQSMREFLPFFNEQILEHHRIQETVKISLEHAQEVAVCSCNMPKAWCTCMTTQAYEHDLFGETELQETSELLDRMKMEDTALNMHAFSMHASVTTKVVLLWYSLLYRYVHCIFWLNFIVSCFLGEDWFWRSVMRSNHKWSVTRDVFRHMGAYAQARIGYPKALAAGLGVLTACYATYKGGRAIFDFVNMMKPQGSTPSKIVPVTEDCTTIGRAPTANCDERPVVSYADPFAFNASDLSQTTLCSAGQDPAVLKRYLERATVVFQTRGDKIRVTTAVNVRGNVYMCNQHGIPKEGDFYLDVIDTENSTLRAGLNHILVTPSMVYREPFTDLAFILLKVRPPGSDITEYFATSTYNALLDAQYIGRQVDGRVWEQEVRNVHPEEKNWPVHDSNVKQSVWTGITNVPTVDGHCGTLMWSKTPKGFVILGIHTLGRGSAVAAARVTREVVKKACELLEPKVVNRGCVTISAPSKTRVLGPLHPQSTVHKSNPGSALVYGSFLKEHRQQSKTCVAPTFISEACVARGFALERTSPDMSRTPWRLALNDMTRPVTLLRNDVLGEAVLDFQNSLAPSEGHVHVYTLDVAINGAPGVLYCDKLNRKTSAGAPYKCPKKRFLFFVDEATSTDVDVTDEIKSEINRMITTYQRGERVHPVYCGHLKDEPVTMEKALAGKTRVFTASGLAHTLVTRMYLLSVIVHMQMNRFTYEMGPGIIVQSLEWEEIYRHISRFGNDKIVAGDYSKFDKRMPATVILAAFDIILTVCTQSGYSDAELAVVRGIAYDTAYPVVDFHGDLIEFYGSNPSGHPLTVIVNGLANSLYMRYVYIILRPIGWTRSFKECVSLMTYGDDNIMGVCDETPWFNHTAIQRVLADVDIGYTMADKEAASVPYISMKDANFLKRTWRKDEDIGAFVAPLDKSSIAKMLTMCTLKANVSPQAHAIQVLGTAVREMFWYGKEEFEHHAQLFQEIVEECELHDYVMDTTFPTWTELCTQFWSNSKHVYNNRIPATT